MTRRSVDTGLWSDERFTELSPDAMLIFFRLMTGDDTGSHGATRVAAKRLAVDTNLTTKRAAAALDELVASDLVRRYDGGWLWMPAWIRYQVSGPDFIKHVRRHSRECPDALRIAIGRALDAHAPRRISNTSRTEKHARSRAKGDRPPPGPPVEGGSEGGSLREKYQDQYQDQNPPPTGVGFGEGPEQASPPTALEGPSSPPVLPEVDAGDLIPITEIAPRVNGVLASTVSSLLERRRLTAVQAERREKP